MGSANLSAACLNLGANCYRLTAQGRACVDLVETQEHTIGSLSRYLHDILMMCGSGVWFDQEMKARCSDMRILWPESGEVSPPLVASAV